MSSSDTQRWCHRRSLCSVALVAVAPLLSLAAVALLARPVVGRLLFNRTPSQPRGLYWLSNQAPQRGSFVALDPPPAIASLIVQRHYLPPGYRLLKEVVAIAGDHVCTSDGRYAVNGLVIGYIPASDSSGRPLPGAFPFCGVVPGAEAWVAGRGATSLDSRFFGPVPVASLTTAVPLWTTSFSP